METRQRRREGSEQTRSDDVASLRRCVRDLVALSGLSAAWNGHKPCQIAESLANVLRHTLLCLDFTYVRLNGQTEGVALDASCTDQGPDTSERTQVIGRALAPWLQSNVAGPAAVSSIAAPFGSGTVRVVLIPIGYEGACGVLVAGSRHFDFPTEAEHVLLSMGANQAAISLQHMRAEQLARRQEQELRDFFENAAEGLHWAGPDGTILWANQAELDLLGYTREEYIGHHIAEFHADPDVIADILERLTRGETLHEYEAQLRGKDGSIRHVLINSNVLWEDGKFIHTRCFTRDITERKQAEQRLKDSEERLRLAVSTAQMGYHYRDFEKGVVKYSEEVGPLCGLPPGASYPTYEDFLKAVHPDDERVAQAIARAAEEDIEYLEEFRIVWLDGTVRWLSDRGKIYRDGSGKPSYGLGLACDITARKQVEEALKRSEERFRALVQASAQIVWATDPSGAAVEDSPSWRAFTGQTYEQWRGWGWLDALQPEDRERTREAWNQAAAERREYVTEYRVRRIDGEYRWTAVRAVPIFNPDGSVCEWVGMNIDITERKQAETESEALLAEEHRLREEAEAATRTKDESVAVVSHELRSPLNAMLSWAQVLEGQETPDPAMVRKAVGIISRNIEQQRQLIDDLLDTARMASGKLKLEIDPLDLVPVTEEALEVVRPAAEAKGIELFSVIDSNCAQVTGDALRLQQVIWNLLSNAVKFTPVGGSIELRLERRDPYVRITVNDTGCGIAPEFLPYLFDRFRQADSASTRRHGGLGLGMALVKHVVELHGGEVRAKSAGLDQGACLTVDLPVRAVRWPTPVAPTSPEAEKGEVNVKRAAAPADLPSLEGVRALVVDDQDEARELVATVLEGYGGSVMAVGSGREALALLEARFESEPPEVLICDIAMPEEDGYCVIRKLRALESERGVHLSRRIPAIALTAFAQPQDRVQALHAGFQIHVAKPVDLAALVAAVNALVRGGGDSG